MASVVSSKGTAAVAPQPICASKPQQQPQQQQLAQAFMGLPIAGGLPMAVGMSPGMMGMLPHFSQVTACKV